MSMPHQYAQQPYDQMHMAQRQAMGNMPSGPPAYTTGQYSQPMHLPSGQALVPQQKPMGPGPNVQTMAIRAYLDQTVVPILVDGKTFHQNIYVTSYFYVFLITIKTV